MSTFFSFFFALLLLVVTHEAGHFFVARMFQVRVLRFSFGFGKVLFRFVDKKKTEYTWSLIPLGGYVKMLDEHTMTVPEEALPYAFNRKPIWARFLIVLAGPVSNFVLTWFLLVCVYMIGFKIPFVLPTVEQVSPDSPAYQAGLMSGDVIQKIDSHVVHQGRDIAMYVQGHPNKTVTLSVLRDGKTHHLDVTLTSQQNEGAHQGRLGVQLKATLSGQTMVHREPFSRAVLMASEKTFLLIKDAFSFVGQLIQGHLSMAQVSGPVGIAKLAGESVEYGIVSYLLFIAMVSISLGVLNLLPIPLLDGGYLAYYVIEWMIRRPLSQRVQICASYVGFGVIFFITAIAFKNDLARLGW